MEIIERDCDYLKVSLSYKEYEILSRSRKFEERVRTRNEVTVIVYHAVYREMVKELHRWNRALIEYNPSDSWLEHRVVGNFFGVDYSKPDGHSVAIDWGNYERAHINARHFSIIEERKIMEAYGVPNLRAEPYKLNNNQTNETMENLKLRKGQMLVEKIDQLKRSIQIFDHAINGGEACGGKKVVIDHHNLSATAISTEGRSTEHFEIKSNESEEIAAAWSNVLKLKADALLKELRDAEEEFKKL